MRIIGFVMLFILNVVCFSFAENKNLLLDDFEGVISGGPQGTVDFGAGNGASVEVMAETKIKYSGKQSLKVVYDAIPGSYMWIARGFDLDASNAGWLIKPQEINWQDYQAVSFYMYGNNSGAQVAFDVKDSGDEMWRFMFEDNFKGWRQIICSFSDFFVRTDWQPANSDKNSTIDFPLKSFQFEPRPEAKGIVYFDKVELIAR
ncbi:MAG: hypothetical protein NC928_00700 [Candidatus Omnitrophica bacterium]|nr:hypothetical protein [Candidatus Omnitrophota bacterium]